MNTLTICRKELNSYFRSPIAYGVMFFFAVITAIGLIGATALQDHLRHAAARSWPVLLRCLSAIVARPLRN